MNAAIKEELTVSELKEKVEFYESIINKLPAVIYINEIEQGGDVSTLKNIWANQWALDFIGYQQDEITKMGANFAKMVTHPEDFKLTPQSLDFHKNNKEVVYFCLNRQKPKNQEDYQWLYQRTMNFKSYPDGSPKQSLNVAFEFHHELQSPNQLVSLLKENSCLKHHLKLKSLTKRENEILKLISEGLTDKEIGKKLCISMATAKTHRNKILKKLGLKNSAGLAAMAVECGL